MHETQDGQRGMDMDGDGAAKKRGPDDKGYQRNAWKVGIEGEGEELGSLVREGGIINDESNKKKRRERKEISKRKKKRKGEGQDRKKNKRNN
jgi:hypothetical protein